MVAGSTTVLALGFGLMVALWAASLPTRWRNALLVVSAITLALPPFLVTNSWLDWLGDTGQFRALLPFRIYSLVGAVWILTLILWPITTFALVAAWRRLEAAQLDCEPALTGFALVRHLLVPIARGELALAAVLTFVLALNNFAVPVILQTQVLPEEMWVRFNTQLDAAGALRLSVPLMVLPMLLLLVWATRHAVSWPRVQGTVSSAIFCRHLGTPWRFGSAAASLLLCALSAGVPVAQIVSAKRTWTEFPGAVEAGTSAIWNSFFFAAIAAVSVTLVATLLTAFKRRRGQPLLASLSAIFLWLPFFVPGVLLGIALIYLFNRPVLVSFYQSSGIVLLAFVIRYFAVGWTGARHALSSTDPDLSDAAKLEGATRWQILRHVQWPQISPQLLAAAYVVYLLCLWDVESMVLVVPPGGETLALRIFNLLHYGYAGQVNALCLALLALALSPMGLWWVGKRTFNIQHSTFNTQGRTRVFLGSLVFGVWCLGTGCSPSSSQHDFSLHSRFFDRAEIIGTRGVGIGEFNKPRSVAVDTKDNLYAVDMTGRVQKFTPDGKYILLWQMPETKLGKPKGMARDLDGNIVVVEPHYQRVNHFTPEGKLVAQWGCKGTNDGCFLLPRGIAENSQGEFLVSEYQGAERVQRFAFDKQKPLTPALSPSDGERGNPRTERGSVTRSSPGSATSLRVTDPRSDSPALRGIIGHAGTAPGEFNRPEGLCVDSHDLIYVADSCNHRIQIFSSDGKFIREYGKPGAGLGQLSYPYDIAVDAQGNQYVCEFGNSRIQVFDANCQPVEIIGGPGFEPGQFANPWGVTLDSHGNLYVADALNHRVQKLMRRTHVAAEVTRQMASVGKNDARLLTSAATVTK